MRALSTAILLAALPAAAQAQISPAVPPGLTVQGSGEVETPPDTATLALSLRGEGKTPDDASRDLAKRQKDVVGGLASLDGKLKLKTGAVAIEEQRKGDCLGSTEIEAVFEGSESGGTDKGPCRVVGYVATIDATVTMSQIDKAGTAVGLAGRLGAVSVRMAGFSLSDAAAARRAALTAAFTDARGRAEAMARASGLKLGPVVSVIESPEMRQFDVVDAAVAEPLGILPPAEIAPPVEIAVSPQPVTTRATVVMVYALLP